jgi:DNA-binding transcriptional regulator YdaS (Cro superfamily)
MNAAIKYFGSQKRMAQAVNVSQKTICSWLHKGVPAERVLEIERATNGHVTRHELRPDLYPID